MVAVAEIDGAAAATRAEDIVRRAGTSFYWAMRFLPRPKREAMFALYAYCREVDDIADEPAPERIIAARKGTRFGVAPKRPTVLMFDRPQWLSDRHSCRSRRNAVPAGRRWRIRSCMDGPQRCS